jgi:hypothetical protein
MRLGNAFKLLIDAVAIPSHQRNKLAKRILDDCLKSLQNAISTTPVVDRLKVISGPHCSIPRRIYKVLPTISLNRSIRDTLSMD